jgi:tRNA-specific 2-thiouridylase
MNFRIGKFFKQSNAVFLFEYKRYHSRIAIAMSGGIDSSAVAMILKDQGYECHGIYMKNWDVVDELESACTNEINYNHMVKVCERLQIPAYKVEFIKEYWTDVFIPYLESYQSGEKTPNPDVFCNRFIKFNYFKKFVKEKLDIDVIATGHYANVKTVIINGKQTVRLLKGNDASKDQSYFLSMTPVSIVLLMLLDMLLLLECQSQCHTSHIMLFT